MFVASVSKIVHSALIYGGTCSDIHSSSLPELYISGSLGGKRWEDDLSEINRHSLRVSLFFLMRRVDAENDRSCEKHVSPILL